MDSFILIPVGLYLVFSGLFIQQGLSNVSLSRTHLVRSSRYLTHFSFASALFCLSLLVVLLSPQIGLKPAEIRLAFFVCWLVAPFVGYLYVKTLSKHLQIAPERIRWMTGAYVFDFVTTVLCGLFTLVTGKPALFSHERGPVQSLVDIHIGGVFSPNGITMLKVGFVCLIVCASTVFFFREILRKKSPDRSLLLGVSLTAIAILVEMVGYLAQWPMAFSLLPLANAVEVMRLTYLQTLEAGRKIEQTQLQLRRDRFHIKNHLESLSHDVRTPLTSLKIGLDQITDEGAYKQLASEMEYLHIVFTNIVSLFELELNSTALTRRKIDIRRSLDAIEFRFENLARERGVTLHVSDEAGLLQVYSDPTALEQALSNLVYNGVIHAASRVAISAFERGEEIIVRVLDDGPAIEDIDLPGLTNRVCRYHLEMRIGCPGWGLGLAISNALTELQGGTLTISTNDDGFTEVELCLPRHIAQPAEPATANRPTVQAPPAERYANAAEAT